MKMNDEQVANTLNTQLVEVTGLRKQIEMYRDELANMRQQLHAVFLALETAKLTALLNHAACQAAEAELEQAREALRQMRVWILRQKHSRNPASRTRTKRGRGDDG